MATDPVKAKSGFLCMYMSNHPDTLVAYAAYHGKLDPKRISEVKMTSIEQSHFMLSYKPSGGGSAGEVKVAFDPPLKDYDEVRPRLLQMKTDAEKALEMIKSPSVNEYSFPPMALATVVLVGFLVYCSTAAPGTVGGRIRDSVGGHQTTTFFQYVAVFLHSLEALYQLSLCRRYGSNVGYTAVWCLSTFLFGFPSFAMFNSIVQEKRIKSIKKA